uniref:Uncharacterized protein n=1 Tax=Anguilla anguilla TaxID=7936 RepID=A0A0E9X523_ANGAN
MCRRPVRTGIEKMCDQSIGALWSHHPHLRPCDLRFLLVFVQIYIKCVLVSFGIFIELTSCCRGSAGIYCGCCVALDWVIAHVFLP